MQGYESLFPASFCIAAVRTFAVDTSMLVLASGFFAFVAIEHQETSGTVELACTLVAITLLVSTAGVSSLLGVRSRTRLQRAAFLQKRRIDELVTSQISHIEKQTNKIGVLETSLKAAQAIVVRVMSDAEAVLRPYAIKYAQIKFGVTNAKLGEGAFGTVFKAQYRDRDVAVKTMRVSKVNEKELTKFKAELTVSDSLGSLAPPSPAPRIGRILLSL